MHIQWKISHWTQSINNQRYNRDIWHEPSIHDIDMNPVTSCQFHSFYLVKIKLRHKMSVNFSPDALANCSGTINDYVHHAGLQVLLAYSQYTMSSYASK
jgi:hypothetical protein